MSRSRDGAADVAAALMHADSQLLSLGRGSKNTGAVAYSGVARVRSIYFAARSASFSRDQRLAFLAGRSARVIVR
jgi:hypothetical protein